ncbi:MAG: hypothetical protein AB3N18_09515 [Allomuricauda sp.]
MKGLYWVICSLFLLNCSKESTGVDFDNKSDLIGTWLLIESYADPGDGSGKYRPVKSDRRMSFFDDGTYTSNASICSQGNESDSEVVGAYEIGDENLSKYSSENVLIPQEDCAFSDFRVVIYFEKDKLILSFPCIEGCGLKFRRL